MRTTFSLSIMLVGAFLVLYSCFPTYDAHYAIDFLSRIASLLGGVMILCLSAILQSQEEDGDIYQ